MNERVKTIAVLIFAVLFLIAGYFWHRELVARAVADIKIAELKPELEKAKQATAAAQNQVTASDEKAQAAKEEAQRHAVEAAQARKIAQSASAEVERVHATNAALLKQLEGTAPPADLPDCLAQLASSRTTAFKLADESNQWQAAAHKSEDAYLTQGEQLKALTGQLEVTRGQIISRDAVILSMKDELGLKDKHIDLLEGKQEGFWNRIRPHVIAGAGPVLCHDGSVRVGLMVGLGWRF